ncbi:MAG: NUDIX domain-containing protein [Parcubacteria group bacterium]|jgi:8-oxo-dGTP pyrophosphatase MutT (NUDIX family)
MIAFEKSVGGVVFRRRGENTVMFLLLHYRHGHWDFPKGHPEADENDPETLKREVSEETGLEDIEILPDFKRQIRFFYRAKDREREERKKSGQFINIAKRVVFYLAETRTKNVKISFEHTGYAWLCYADALNRITYANSKNVLTKANAHLSKITASGL